MQKVLVIVGPTASGKSDLAIKLAKKFNGEIISADSRQVYKGLNIGTGKVTKKEMKGIPHHLLDVANHKKQFTASQYGELAVKKIIEIIKRKKLPIIVGGTGFYIDTITCGVLFPNVPPNPKLRKKLLTYSLEKLFKLLQTKDPERAKNIDKNNKVRLVRALEIVDTLGKVPALSERKDSVYKFIFIGLNLDQDDLNKKILNRLKQRIPGMIKEAKKLHELGLSWKRMEELGLEYRYLARLLQKKITFEQFENELFSEIKKYSKRQKTWFKRNKNIKWFNPNEFKKIEKYARMATLGD